MDFYKVILREKTEIIKGPFMQSCTKSEVL